MHRWLKATMVTLLLVAAVIVGLTLFIRFTFTEDRLKTLLIPAAEKVLNRPVAIDRLQIGILSGITISNATIKELDGSGNLLTIDTIALRYDLWKLLQRQLAISEITVVNPQIHIVRNRQGLYNISNLSAPPDEISTPPAVEQPSAGKTAALLLAVTVAELAVDNLSFSFHDALEQLPTVQGTGDLRLSMHLDPRRQSWTGKGLITLAADLHYHTVRPHLAGTITFNQDQASYTVTLQQEAETIRISGLIDNFFHGPAITADLYSEQIHADYLAGLLGSLTGSAPAQPPAVVKSATTKNTPTAKKGHPGRSQATSPAPTPQLTAKGSIDCKQVIYNRAAAEDFHCFYRFDQGMLTIRDIRGRTAGGTFAGAMEIDLKSETPPYRGELAADTLQVPALLSMYSPKAPVVTRGTLQTNLTFAGRGVGQAEMEKHLTARGTYVLRDGQLQANATTKEIVRLLKLPQLADPSFDDLSGNFQLKKGNVSIDSSMQGDSFSATGNGRIGLDGTLALPVTVRLGPTLSNQFQQQFSWGTLLLNKAGETELSLFLEGTIGRPKVTLDTHAAQQQLEKQLQQTLDTFLGNKKTPAEGTRQQPALPLQELIPKLFGR
ncbi:MAG: hypothetical protein JXO49_09025 [Deltaproteobacteria bacterium]|nr:hypothetical protein [Candidatus Anaeroferrophillus wilburensis]MBN2889471.1 hypothetical protein [Deltaproteobacteria bacterium]